MIFKGVNGETIEFSLEYSDYSEMTGFIFRSEVTMLSLYLRIQDTLTMTGIYVLEVEKIINWFEKLLSSDAIQPRLLTLHDQFYFDVGENNSNGKVVYITYDTTVPVPGMGGYSLAPGRTEEDLFKKMSMKCEMNTIQIERVIKKLKAELTIEMEIGQRVESQKPKEEL